LAEAAGYAVSICRERKKGRKHTKRAGSDASEVKLGDLVRSDIHVLMTGLLRDERQDVADGATKKKSARRSA
jgi:hypothetical protein